MSSSSNKNSNKDHDDHHNDQGQHNTIHTPSFMHTFEISNISSPSSPVVSDPKPEWKPNQHQAQILEELFIGGTVNPSLTSIKQITIKLQSYGEEVDDADVYKWFHNRKYSRKPKS
ncbi:Homeodomain-like superfamily protein [Arabidopsis thaliana]|uniref:Homeodomain-like superfamily protein n=1 Tax=Arabidopsis thaliana TaxID=3702 RepID=F4KG06_ARATH|nr:Homeodomain-like superfamily protein [Arabidopsis thaliana]AED95326.2 Homeodomain-like superfamily protein [Arabidopsis thaliana]|eukprot:NP_001318748.1 Homeodomain-like superfamily protein [Arabidopsis thaliana]